MTTEQKDLLQNFQKQFDSQSDFVVHLLDLLQNGKQPLPVDDTNVLRVKVTPFQRELLSYLAGRETTKNVFVTPDNILTYVFDEMLVKGNKFSIDSIPNSVIRKYKKEFPND